MASHRRIKQAKKVIKNVRKFRTWFRRSRKRLKTKLHAINKRGGNLGKVHCYSCNQWIHKDWMWDHIQSHEKQRKQGVGKAQPQKPPQKPAQKPTQQNQWGPWQRVPNQGSAVPVTQPQKQAPPKNPPKQQQNRQNRPKLSVVKPPEKGKQMAKATGGDEGTDTPHAGNDEVSNWFSQWAGRYPSNYEVNHQDAESMGEVWHAVADAYRRKAQMLVEENHFPPSIVEPYEESADLCARIADLHKEMADRTQSTFATLIEAMQGPVPRDPEFAKPK